MHELSKHNINFYISLENIFAVTKSFIDHLRMGCITKLLTGIDWGILNGLKTNIKYK